MRLASGHDSAFLPVILYSLLRAVGGIALRWYYRDIEVFGRERLPDDAPVILVANHPNALVDALVIGHVIPRQVRLTAKGTFFEHPLIGPLFRAIGIIPLHRAREASGADATRNADAFRAILDALERKRMVLIFPEGTTHSGPELVPLRTGAARLALAARDDRSIRGVRIVPVGLVFEDKSRVRSRVLVQFGLPLSLDDWMLLETNEGESRVHRLTTEIDTQLRAVTLNFPTTEIALNVRRIARLLSDALDPPRPVAAPYQPLAQELVLTGRVEAVRRIMAASRLEAGETPDTPTPTKWTAQAVASWARALLARIDAFSSTTDALGIAINDVDISLSSALGARFAIREGSVAIGTAPLAWWGRLNHWLPFRAAAAMGRRPRLHPEEPAMHTIVWGLLLVLVAYVIQASVVAWFFGGWWAAGYLISLPPSASWDLRYRDRLSRAFGRMRSYLRFRRDPSLQQRLATELAFLRSEASEIARLAEGGTERHGPIMEPLAR